jgi:hypothetical protein
MACQTENVKADVSIDTVQVTNPEGESLATSVTNPTGQALTVQGKSGGTEVPVIAKKDMQAYTVLSGMTTAPRGNSVLLDSGALAAGDYEIKARGEGEDTTANPNTHMLLHHVQSDGTTIIRTLFRVNEKIAAGCATMHIEKYHIGTNEHLLWKQGTADAPLSTDVHVELYYRTVT